MELRDLIKKAEQGCIDAQYKLGRLYRSERLYKYAFHWLMKAARQGHVVSQNEVYDMLLLCRTKINPRNAVGKILYWAQNMQRDDKTTFYWLLEFAEQKKIDLEKEFDNQSGRIRNDWDTEDLENILGLTESVPEPSLDPYYCPRYSPYENPNDELFDRADELYDEIIKITNRSEYKNGLKKKIKEGTLIKERVPIKKEYQSPDVILAIKETKGGVAYSWKYSGKGQILILANKNIYKIPPHIDEISRSADKYFECFYDVMRHAMDMQGRLLTFSECRRYEDYFVLEVPGTFECAKVSIENKIIKRFVEKFKEKYRKQDK